MGWRLFSPELSTPSATNNASPVSAKRRHRLLALLQRVGVLAVDMLSSSPELVECTTDSLPCRDLRSFTDFPPGCTDELARACLYIAWQHVHACPCSVKPCHPDALRQCVGSGFTDGCLRPLLQACTEEPSVNYSIVHTLTHAGAKFIIGLVFNWIA